VVHSYIVLVYAVICTINELNLCYLCANEKMKGHNARPRNIELVLQKAPDVEEALTSEA
jgi:hypothetical protein